MTNWRLFAVRLVTSCLAVVLTVGLLPGLRITSWHWGELLLMGVVFGVLNAVLKPVMQFFALRYLVASYGLVIVLINAVLLALLSWILGSDIEHRGPVALLAGGFVVGVLGLVLDTAAGTNRPWLDRPVRDSGESGEEP
jgi:putative membrane protein